jgi:hypothetical protein
LTHLWSPDGGIGTAEAVQGLDVKAGPVHDYFTHYCVKGMVKEKER